LYKRLETCVVIPAFNEEHAIAYVIKSVPRFVDHIIVVNDASTDGTERIAKKCTKQDSRVEVISHGRRGGVGAAIISGHMRALDLKADVVAVMAGDGQMNPDYLHLLIDRIVEGYDYAKGNRFLMPGLLAPMPKYRIVGNIILSFVSKASSGYWNVFDHDNGYTVIRTTILRKLPLNRIAWNYNFERDMLVNLNIIGARVADVPMESKYPDRYSKIHLYSFIPRTTLFMIRRYFRRIFVKYLFNDVRPFGVLFLPGFLMFVWGFLYGAFLAYQRYLNPQHQSPSTGTVMLAIVPLFIGIQLLLFAFVLDILEAPR
jgi:glycosyltransferase involved in cell wall biosynthesis